MVKSSSRERLVNAHDGLQTAWEELQRAEAALLAAQQELKTARENYQGRLKGFETIVKICTPGATTPEVRR